MKRLVINNNFSQLVNQLFSYRERSLRFKHHIDFITYYQTRNTIPKGFLLNFHAGTLDLKVQQQVNSVLHKCSVKLMSVFKRHYLEKLQYFSKAERKLCHYLRMFYPQDFGNILQKLEERTNRVNLINETRRICKYIRDGLPLRKEVEPTSTMHVTHTTIQNLQNQNHQPINLTDKVIDVALINLCSRGPSFVPTPVNVDWNDLQQGWLDFKRKIRWRAYFYEKDLPHREQGEPNLKPPYQKSVREPPSANIPAIEVFLSRVEKDIFHNDNYRSVQDNITKEERNALKNFRAKPPEERNLVLRLQDKGNNFVFLDPNLDEQKVIEQMNRGSFQTLNKDPSADIVKEIEIWINKWKLKGLSKEWISFISSNKDTHPGVNYPLVKTHKVDNPARVITSGCGTPIENLSLFVERYCSVVVGSISCRVQDTSHMLRIIDELNDKGIFDGDILVSFDIVNMFPSIDNSTGVERVLKKLESCSSKFDIPVPCIIEALQICLNRNCSTFRGQYWLQNNGTAMGPKNSCSYADIVAEHIDFKVMESRSSFGELQSWFRFRDDTFVLWRGSRERLDMFFDTLNNFDSHLKFTMDVGGNTLHFLDLLISISNNRLETSVYSKPTDAHLYLNSRSCHPRSQLLGIAKGVALRLRRICSQENDYLVKSDEYANYLIQCGHEKSHVLKQFEEVGAMTRQEARKSKKKCKEKSVVFVSKYNPHIPDIRKIINKHIYILQTDSKASKVLPNGSFRVVHKRGANLKELLAPSNPYKNNKTFSENAGCHKCSTIRCDCCTNFLIEGSSFYSSATKRTFKIQKKLTCNSQNVIYLAECVSCNLQGVGSTLSFKPRLANYKSHIKYKRRTCGIVNHFLDFHNADHSSLKFRIIDQNDTELRTTENFWIGTLLTNFKGLNCSHDFNQQ